MDEGKNQLFEERRVIRAETEDIFIQFRDSQHFDVLLEDDEGIIEFEGIKYKIKYQCKVASKIPAHEDDCTCRSFYFGNSDEYKKANPGAFQCKHLIAGRRHRHG